MHEELITKLRNKIDEATTRMQKSDEAERKTLGQLVREMDELMEEIKEKMDLPEETFAERVATVVRKVSDRLKGM